MGGALLKHYRRRFFRYLDPNSAEVQSYAVVKLYFEINSPNCTRLTHWHVLFNMCTSTRAFLSGRAAADGSAPFSAEQETRRNARAALTVGWKRPRDVSFPLIRWPLRHPDGPTKHRLTLSAISSHSLSMWKALLCVCRHVDVSSPQRFRAFLDAYKVIKA